MANYTGSAIKKATLPSVSLLNPKATDPKPEIILKPTATSATATKAATSQPTVRNDPYVTGLDDRGETDYSVLIRNLMSRGASADQVQTALSQRNAKAILNGYTDYQDDATARAAQAYINGMKATASQPFSTFQDMLESGGYNRVQAANDAALAAKLSQLEGFYGGQKANIAADADERARQAYVSYMQSRNSLPQSMAASGLTGGMADSQRLALELGLQNNQREIGQARAAAMNDLDTALNNARAQTTIQGLESEAALAQQAVSNWNDWMKTHSSQAFQAGQNALDREQSDKWNALNLSYQKWVQEKNWGRADAAQAEELAMQYVAAGLTPPDDLVAAAEKNPGYYAGLAAHVKEQADKAEAAERVSAILSTGGTPSESDLALMGYTTAQAQAMAAYYKQKAAKRTTSGGTRAASTPATAKGSLFSDMAASGNPYTYLVSNYGKYGVAYNGLSGVWKEYQDWAGAGAGSSGTAPTAGNEMSAANFSGLKQTILTYLRSGDEQGAWTVLYNSLDGVSDVQAEELERYIEANRR